MTYDAAEIEARRRRKAVAPITRDYSDLTDETVLWPLVGITSRPNVATPVVTTDSRGHRISRSGDDVARSDEAPADAGFVLGGSFVFGVGAADDSGTLPSALWRRTGRPYVNLGIRQATSTQELISALPFAERETTFVVCSGLNNFAIARAPALDSLFGPTYLDRPLRRLSAVPVDELERMVKKGGRIDADSARKPRRELLRRFRPATPAKPPAEPRENRPGKDPDPDTMVETASVIQLRDLRALRRLVPDSARVVFALQPVAPRTGKELTDEERSLFEALDVMQAGTTRWRILSQLFETHWDAYAERLAAGCAALGVPFADLSRAEYTGWCFIDRIHMTERGYEIAAAFLDERLLDGAR